MESIITQGLIAGLCVVIGCVVGKIIVEWEADRGGDIKISKDGRLFLDSVRDNFKTHKLVLDHNTRKARIEPIKQNNMSAADFSIPKKQTYNIELTEKQLAALYLAISTSEHSRSMGRKVKADDLSIAYFDVLDKEISELETTIKTQTGKTWAPKEISSVFLQDVATKAIEGFFKNKDL